MLLAIMPGLISCSRSNPPFGELADTRWEGTNIAKGILIDVQTGPKNTYDISMVYYLDTTAYDIRGAKVDTAGNRQFVIEGTYEPIEATTDRGKKMYGYNWDISGQELGGKEHSGTLNYDNCRMYLNLDGDNYPMTQIL